MGYNYKLYFSFMCTTKKIPAHIFFVLYPIGAMIVFPIISPLSLLYWARASLKKNGYVSSWCKIFIEIYACSKC